MQKIYYVKTYTCDLSEESEEILNQRLFENYEAAKIYFEKAKAALNELDDVKEVIEDDATQNCEDEYIIDRQDFYSVTSYDDICYNVRIEEVEVHDKADNLPVFLQFNY